MLRVLHTRSRPTWAHGSKVCCEFPKSETSTLRLQPQNTTTAGIQTDTITLFVVRPSGRFFRKSSKDGISVKSAEGKSHASTFGDLRLLTIQTIVCGWPSPLCRAEAHHEKDSLSQAETRRATAAQSLICGQITHDSEHRF